ncbi:MAG: histidine kinase [Bacteroidota bacterium]
MRLGILSTKILTLASQPKVLALIALLLTLLLTPHEFSSHKLELKQTGYHSNPFRNSAYIDMDGDGINERILMRNLNTNGNLVAFSQSDRILGTWHLPGLWHMVPSYCFADTDDDSIQEIFTVSINSGDSVLVSQIELSDSEGTQKNRFVCELTRINDAFDHIFNTLGLFDMTGDSEPDFVFYISAGFSLQPRACYAWDLVNDTLISSPFAGFNIRNPHSYMESNDGNLVFVTTTATQNYHYPIPYSDTASYAVVLREGLEYLFDPVYMGGRQSMTTTLPLSGQGENRILAITADKRKDHARFILRILNQSGEILRIREGVDLPKASFALIWNQRLCIFASDREGFSLFEVSKDLQLSELYSESTPYAHVKALNLDSDSNSELLLVNLNDRQFAVLDDELKSLARTESVSTNINVSSVSMISRDQAQHNFFIQTRGTHYLLAYHKNPFYPFRWSYYVALYGGFFILFLGLQKLFLFRNRQKKAKEKEVIELQLKAVMNQLNPHFTFNAINTIGQLMMKGEKSEGYEHFVRLSDLVRKSMINAFEPYKTLGEEIEFVAQYLKIESFRFREKLSWELNIDPEVDKSILIPKMLIHLFAENAIKHGIFHKENGGRLEISIQKISSEIVIIVTDDGVGRSKAFSIEKRSGDGMRILDNYLLLFNRQHRHTVKYRIKDREELDPSQSGTQVKISIKLK